MSDDPKEPQGDEPLAVKERFEKTAQIALLMTYDLIDKLRYWEKETLKLPEDQIEERLAHLHASVDQLRAAYLTFTDLDL